MLRLAINKVERPTGKMAPPSKQPQQSKAPAGTDRVGTLDTLNLAVYARADGSLYYNDDGRVDVHGNTKWTTLEGTAMKGQLPFGYSDKPPPAAKPMQPKPMQPKPMPADKPVQPKPMHADNKVAHQMTNKDKENASQGVKAGGKKIALVVGVSKYKSAPLKNPVNDATAMAAKLKSMGFDVILVKDCSEENLTKATRIFTDSLNRTVQCAMFFFAGHGCEYQNQNYLMTTTECPDERDLPKKAVSAHEIQQAMEQSGCLFPVLVLDCCRVFEGMTRSTRAPPKGMAKMEPKGSYLALACAPNTCAEDGHGANGTFTAALLEHVGTPSLDIDTLMRRVRTNVEADTNGRQVPWSNHTLKIEQASLV